MLKLIEIHLLLWVPEMSWLLQLRAPTVLLHTIWWESVLHLWHLIYVLNLHIFILTIAKLSIIILIGCFWEVVASLRVTTALILSTSIAIGMV